MAMGETTLICLEQLVGDQWKRSVVGLAMEAYCCAPSELVML